MAGVVSPVDAGRRSSSRTRRRGNRAFATLNEGLGKVLRFGAYDAGGHRPAALVSRDARARRSTPPSGRRADRRHHASSARRCRWATRATTGTSRPPRAARPRGSRPADRRAARRRRRGARLPARQRPLLPEPLDGRLQAVHGRRRRRRRARRVVTAMSRNGVEFGIRVARHRRPVVHRPGRPADGLYFPGYGPDDANPDLGDSAITETLGIGGFAMAASPAIVTLRRRHAGRRAGRDAARCAGSRSRRTRPSRCRRSASPARPTGIDGGGCVETGGAGDQHRDRAPGGRASGRSAPGSHAPRSRCSLAAVRGLAAGEREA